MKKCARYVLSLAWLVGGLVALHAQPPPTPGPTPTPSPTPSATATPFPTPVSTAPIPPSLYLIATGLGGAGLYELRKRLKRR